jgi:hypothetical protein
MKIRDYILGGIILVLLVIVAIQFFTRPDSTDPLIPDFKKQKDSLSNIIANNKIKLDSLEIVDAVKDSIISRKLKDITYIYEVGMQDYYNTLALNANKSLIFWTNKINKERLLQKQ